MIKEDEKVDPHDLPEECEVDDYCTVRINREAGTVELYSMDLEVMNQEGHSIGTISRTGQPLCSLPLDSFEWTYVVPAPETIFKPSDLEEAERIKSAKKSRAA